MSSAQGLVEVLPGIELGVEPGTWELSDDSGRLPKPPPGAGGGVADSTCVSMVTGGVFLLIIGITKK